ncbi:Monooxygenase FAD-binding protein [Macrophomina phaseolina MS6]|uniref:Monooxygenase FAD-binding protein n=1 Tax=Macrophomina phaseolina (strain MS6) TaxID=1126212 RepID=K2SDB1_MACPH|nr:Monooxygenase FAD-binding protein [Macrophomina phaseolina MS6]
MYPDFEEAGQRFTRSSALDGSTSKPLAIVDLGDSSKERFGYESLILGRYDTVAILEKHIKQKERLIPNKRAVEIETLEDKVLVHCQDGSTYEGQIVVGADGVHSAVRREMWKAAEKLEPGAIPAEDLKGVRVDFASLFGTARQTDSGDVCRGDVIATHLQDHNGMVFPAKDDRIFYFWHFKLPDNQLFSANALPRFTKEEGLASLNKFPDLPASTSCTTKFSDIIKNTFASGTTALPHYVFRKWSFRRIVIIGDAAHKPNPITGQGGNNCIESAAALVNSIVRAFAADGVLLQGARWPASSITTAFHMLEMQRFNRVLDVVEGSRQAQSVYAWSTWKSRLTSRYIVPLLSTATQVGKVYGDVARGVKLAGKEWEIAPRPHTVPFEDERPLRQEKSGRGDITLAVSAGAAVIAVVVATRHLWGAGKLISE